VKVDKENSDVEKLSNQVVRALLYSNGGTCNKFFNGISPANLYREHSTRLMLERYMRLITRYNTYIDAIVEVAEIPNCPSGKRTLSQNKCKPENQTVLRLINSRLNPIP